jgi:predicted DNA-binding transcriptional regulator YafY
MLARVEAALPERLRTRLAGTPLFAPGFHVRPEVVEGLAMFRNAIDERRKVWFAYEDADGVGSERAVRPLGLFFWGYSWSMTGWCELRNDFRNFRLDRIADARLVEGAFVDEPGKTLNDYFRLMDNDRERGSV